jgi:hypothetical protein
MSWINVGGNWMVAREQAVHRLFGFVVFPGGRALPRLGNRSGTPPAGHSGIFGPPAGGYPWI